MSASSSTTSATIPISWRCSSISACRPSNRTCRSPSASIAAASSTAAPIAGYFAQRRNVVRPSFLRMTRDILRFNRLAPRLLANAEDLDFTIGDFIDDAGLSDAFRDRYLLPMASCIWSTPLGRVLDYPAQTLARFFHNHGLLTVGPQLHWRTVQRRQPVLCRTHRGAAAPPGTARHAGQRAPSRRRGRAGARHLGSLGPLRQGRARLPCRPGAGVAGRRDANASATCSAASPIRPTRCGCTAMPA